MAIGFGSPKTLSSIRILKEQQGKTHRVLVPCSEGPALEAKKPSGMKCSLEVTSLPCFEPMPANALMATSFNIVSPQVA
jgi:hypothetical protein